MQQVYSDELLCLAARLYYVDGLSQNDVAKFVQVSQAKVSRLLSMARERGIVRVSVADYEPRHKELEMKVRKRFGLATVIVIKTVEGLDIADRRHSLGYFAAPILAGLIGGEDTVALAGGRNILELIGNLPETQDKALTVVQTMGNIDSSVSACDSGEVARLLTHKLGGNYLALNTPAYVSNREMRDALWELEQVRKVREHLARADFALIGIGTLEDSLCVERVILKHDDLQALREAGAVGEVCGRFIDKDGNECPSCWHDLVIGIELAHLRRIPRSLAVVAGQNRAAAVNAAIRGKLINGLILDQTGAAELLALPVEAVVRTARGAAK
jgi:DNA-binding transcriptional regulator LsrR (DeoR family)